MVDKSFETNKKEESNLEKSIKSNEEKDKIKKEDESNDEENKNSDNKKGFKKVKDFNEDIIEDDLFEI